jgi:hypothetical protein
MHRDACEHPLTRPLEPIFDGFDALIGVRPTPPYADFVMIAQPCQSRVHPPHKILNNLNSEGSSSNELKRAATCLANKFPWI